MEGLGADPQRLGEGGRAGGHHHELLEVERVLGVRSAVDDVHERNREHARVLPADPAVERTPASAAAAFATASETPSTAFAPRRALLGVPSRLQQEPVDRSLVPCVRARERRADLTLDVLDRVEDALAEIERCVAARRLDRFEPPRRGAGGHRRPARALPESSSTSTSTVGLPRESRTCRACTRVTFTECPPLPGRSTDPAPPAGADLPSSPARLRRALHTLDEAPARRADASTGSTSRRRETLTAAKMTSPTRRTRARRASSRPPAPARRRLPHAARRSSSSRSPSAPSSSG